MVFLIVFSIILYWTIMDTTRQVSSHSLLSHPNIVLAHFKEVKTRAHNLSVDMNKKEMYTYCISEWPNFWVDNYQRIPSISSQC